MILLAFRCLFYQFGSIFLWREAQILAEEAYEVRCVGKSHRVCHFAHAQVGAQQHGLCFLNFLLQDVLQRRQSERLTKGTYQVRLRQAGTFGQCLYADGLAQMLLDIVHRVGYARVCHLHARLSAFHEETEDDGYQPQQLHALEKFEVAILLHIFVVGQMVVEGVRLVGRQAQLRKRAAVGLEQRLDGLVAFSLGRKFVEVEDVGLTVDALEYKQIVCGEAWLALVCMTHVVGNQVEVSRTRFHIALGQVEHGSPAHYIKYTREGRRDILVLRACPLCLEAQVRNDEIGGVQPSGQEHRGPFVSHSFVYGSFFYLQNYDKNP